MIKKRYDIEYDGNCYKCIVDCEKGILYTDRKQIVDLLNKLNDENELLKEENRSLYVDIDFLTRFIEKRGFKLKRNLKEVLELMK